MSKRTVVPMLKDLLEEFDGDRIQLVIGSSRHLLNLRTMEARDLPPKKLIQFPVRSPQNGLANSAPESDVCPDRNEREGEPHHMQRFLITSENQMVTINSTAETPERGTAFDSEQQLAEVTSDWPASRLVEIWNALPGVTAIRKFKDRATDPEVQGPRHRPQPHLEAGPESSSFRGTGPGRGGSGPDRRS